MQIQTPLTATKYRADDATLRDATGRVIGTMSMADAEALVSVASATPDCLPDGCRGVSCDTGAQTVTLRFETFEHAVAYFDAIKFKSPAATGSGDLRTQQGAPTEAQVLHAARALADRHTLAGKVNKDDNWRVYGECFTADARCVLDAVRGAA